MMGFVPVVTARLARSETRVPIHDSSPTDAVTRTADTPRSPPRTEASNCDGQAEGPMSRETVDADEEPTFPTCPTCDSPIAMVTMVGPTDGIASPCGCQFVPELHE
jgi:hypothetical protein